MSRSWARVCQLLSGPDSTTIKTTTTKKATITIPINPDHELLYKDNLFNYYKVKIPPGTKMRFGTVRAACLSAGMRAVCSGPPGCESSRECVHTPLNIDQLCGYVMWVLNVIFSGVKIILAPLFRHRLGWVLGCCPVSHPNTTVGHCPRAQVTWQNGVTTGTGWNDKCPQRIPLGKEWKGQADCLICPQMDRLWSEWGEWSGECGLLNNNLCASGGSSPPSGDVGYLNIISDIKSKKYWKGCSILLWLLCRRAKRRCSVGGW